MCLEIFVLKKNKKNWSPRGAQSLPHHRTLVELGCKGSAFAHERRAGPRPLPSPRSLLTASPPPPPEGGGGREREGHLIPPSSTGPLVPSTTRLPLRR